MITICLYIGYHTSYTKLELRIDRIVMYYFVILDYMYIMSYGLVQTLYEPSCEP